MTLKECYIAMNANYEDVIGRLRSERLVQKFVLKFLDDKSFDALYRALQNGETTEAFRAAHTIKGVCQNLSFTALERSSEAITETLRSGDLPLARTMFAAVKADYDRTVSAIRAYQASLS